MRSFYSKLSTVDEKDLTTKEKKIVNYINNNLKEIVETNMKIERMAQEAGTGYSAIYGLLKKLNIRGFRDFAISLANDADTQFLNIAKNDESVMAGYINIIKQNYSLVEKKRIFESLNVIRQSKRIFVCYWENLLSGPAAYLVNFFYNQDINSYLLDNDQNTLNERILSSREDDLFIFFTKYGNSTRLDKFISHLGDLNRKIIYISGKIPSNDVKPYLSSTHTILVDNPDKNIFDGNISPSVPFSYFDDLLIYHFLNSSQEE